MNSLLTWLIYLPVARERCPCSVPLHACCGRSKRVGDGLQAEINRWVVSGNQQMTRCISREQNTHQQKPQECPGSQNKMDTKNRKAHTHDANTPTQRTLSRVLWASRYLQNSPLSSKDILSSGPCMQWTWSARQRQMWCSRWPCPCSLPGECERKWNEE